MENTSNNLLTPFDLTLFLVGSMCGLRILHASIDVAVIAKQDGWICIFLGSIYPIIIVLLVIYLSSRYPNDNILSLSTRFLGNILGTAFNFFYLFGILFYISAGVSSLSNILRLYVSQFLIPIKIVIFELLSAAFISSKNIKAISRVNTIIILTMIVSSITLLSGFNEGTILNIMPILDSSFKNIFWGSIKAATNYRGIELLLIFYPYINNKKKLVSSSFLSVLITVTFFTWNSFMTFYFLGTDLIPKNLYPFLFVTDNLTIPIINNFRYIFIFLWSLVGFNFISIFLFASTKVSTTLFPKVKKNLLVLIPLPLIAFASISFGNEALRRSIVKKLSPYLSLFILLYIVLVIIMSSIRMGKGNANEKV